MTSEESDTDSSYDSDNSDREYDGFDSPDNVIQPLHPTAKPEPTLIAPTGSPDCDVGSQEGRDLTTIKSFDSAAPAVSCLATEDDSNSSQSLPHPPPLWFFSQNDPTYARFSSLFMLEPQPIDTTTFTVPLDLNERRDWINESAKKMKSALSLPSLGPRPESFRPTTQTRKQECLEERARRFLQRRIDQTNLLMRIPYPNEKRTPAQMLWILGYSENPSKPGSLQDVWSRELPCLGEDHPVNFVRALTERRGQNGTDDTESSGTADETAV